MRNQLGSPSSQAPTYKALSTHLPWEQPLTSRAGVLMSTGSMTVNIFLARRAGTQGRCRVALMQYRTLPCLPSNDVTSVLRGGRKGLQGGEKHRHAGGGWSQRLRRMRDRDTEGPLPPRGGESWGPEGPQKPSNGDLTVKGAAGLGIPLQSRAPDAGLTEAAGS